MYKKFILGCISFLIVGCGASVSNENLAAYAKKEPNLEVSHVLENNTTAESEERIQEVYWKLIGVMGKAVVTKTHEREAYLILKLENNRLQGFGGCNLLMGNYELNEGNRVVFSKVASTMMACPNMMDESAFLKILGQVDSYTIKDGVLMLHQAKKSPLATFEAVYPQ